MQMVNMKNEEKECDCDMEHKAQGLMPEKPEYPYGLSIDLGEESLAKLEMEKLPQVGEEMMVHAKVTVKAVSQSDYEGKKSRNVCFQITDMAIDMPKDLNKVAQKFYEKK